MKRHGSASRHRASGHERHPVGSLDLNPFLVRPEGEGALALDAVLVTAPSPGALGSAAAQGQGRD